MLHFQLKAKVINNNKTYKTVNILTINIINFVDENKIHSSNKMYF